MPDETYHNYTKSTKTYIYEDLDQSNGYEQIMRTDFSTHLISIRIILQ